MVVRRYNMQVLADSDTLNKIIDWKMSGPPFGIGVNHTHRSHSMLAGALTEEQKMQRQFTIELRVDYADNEKNESMRTALSAAARHMYATAVLLADAVKPQIAIFSDDFFSGHEQIALLEDTVGAGKAALVAAGDTNEGDTGVSSELMDAMRASPANGT